MAYQSFVKAIYDYNSTESTDLSFFTGDIIKVINHVDDNWIYGELHGNQGLLPTNFIEPYATQDTTTHTVVATETYISGEDGVLTYFLGDTITFLGFVDGHYWCKGQLGKEIGLFQASTVEGLDKIPHTFIADHSNTKIPEASSPDEIILPEDSLNDDVVVDLNEPCAEALYDFQGATEYELTFKTGEIIKLTNDIDNDWFEGSYKGKMGIFPKNFVNVLTPLLAKDDDSLQESTEEVIPFAIAAYPFVGETRHELSFRAGDIIYLNSWISPEWIEGECDGITGIFPSSFVQIQVDLPNKVDDSEWQNRNDYEHDSGSYKIGDKAVAICSFNTDIQGDLPLEVGDVITIKNIIDEEWVEGRKNGVQFGLCPIVFLQHQHLPSGTTPVINHTSLLPNSTLHITETTTTDIEPLPADNIKPEKTVTQKPVHGPKPNISNLKPNITTKPSIAPKPAFLKKSKNTATKMSSVNHNITNKPEAKTTSNTWVTFDEQSSQNTSKLLQKTLLDKSLDKEEVSSAPVLIPNTSLATKKGVPTPPPRIDLQNRSVSDNLLSNKIAKEMSALRESSQRKSPSLNELRLNNAQELHKDQLRPVPLRRTKLQPRPASYHSDSDTGVVNCDNGFPILHELQDQITSLKNELQKETKVLSGIDVLMEMVHDESKKEELQSNKSTTERKIYDVKRKLRKTQEHQKHLEKAVSSFNSYNEIKLKIEQIKESIKENVATRNNLQLLLLENNDKETVEEIQENIGFCEHAISNLETELKSLQDLLEQLEGCNTTKEEPLINREKNVELRIKVISEILDTEKSFGQDLNLCVHHYMEQLMQWNVDGIDYDVLFGNLPEVALLSTKFLSRLTQATQDIDVSDQYIGNCFVEFSEEITQVYGTYCRNHDDAIAFLEKSANDEEIQQYFKKCLESIREHSSCWDLSSFLIKPVQRILKYPLLLNELLKNTAGDHGDKNGLIKAIEVMTRAANDVNEFKRRKDLVQKYQKVEDSGLSTRIQKFTWHSVVKKSTRFNQRITQLTGLKNQTIDETFNEIEKQFYHIEKNIKNFIKNTTQYLEQFEEVHVSQMTTAADILDYHHPDIVLNEIQEFYDAQKNITEHLFTQLKNTLDKDVITPLDSLVRLMEGPRRLIQKRHDKCLDYDSWANKIEKIKDSDKLKQAKEELEFAKKNYEALNTQLLDELPILNEKAIIFLQTCIKNFAKVHNQFYIDALDQFSPSVQLFLVQPGNNDIISDFLTSGKLASHEVFQLTFVPMKTSTTPKPLRPVLSPKSLQGEESRTNSLKRSNSDRNKKLSPEFRTGGIVRSQTVSAGDRTNAMKRKLNKRRNLSSSSFKTVQHYVVKFLFVAENDSELSVNKGDVVTLVQHHDNIGNSEWWQVEHHGKTGYVPAQFLVPYNESPINEGS